MGIKMVDITHKEVSFREAIAEGVIKLKEETVRRIKEGKVEKGDVFALSTAAAILAIKKTPEIVPLTHNILITSVKVDYDFIDSDKVKVRVTVRTTAKTGVEMEAIMGVLAALANIWDMVKKYEKDEAGQYPHTRIEYVRVVSKVKKPLEE